MMRKYAAVCLAGLFFLLAALSVQVSVCAQVTLPQPGEFEVRPAAPPLIELDRKTVIRAFEPIYLCLTAEQFPPGVEAEVQIGLGSTWSKVNIPDKEWVKTEIRGRISLLRRGIVLHSTETNGVRTFLFKTPGEYKIHVKIGQDATIRTLKVTAAEAGEEAAWTLLGDRIEDVIHNNFPDTPEQGTIDACGKIVVKYPKTICASYCSSYIQITKFKIAFEKFGKGGGAKVYSQIAGDLEKFANGFHESFYGELMAFYAGYAKGLSGDFPRVVVIADNMQTHMTQWNEGVMEMRSEILAHILPKSVPIDPSQRVPTTEPSTQPATSLTVTPAAVK